MNLNKAMIIGNLTRDPEMKTTTTGQQIANFSIATSMVWTDQSGQQQKKSEFHNIVAWRKLAEVCGKYLHKGSKIYAEGRLQTSDWAAQDGTKRYKTEIVLENMIMLDTKGASTPGSYSAPENNAVDADVVDDEEIRVENIPF